jgi:PAS domain S-box-containing protein
MSPKRQSRARQPSALRKKAETRLRRAPKLKKAPTVEQPQLERVVHALRVHQVELEMQNEALRIAQAQADEARAGLAELYEFAPAGYFTVDEQGTIRAVNTTGALLFGIERRLLLNRRFEHFVKPGTRPDYRKFFGNIQESQIPQTCEIAIIKPHDDAILLLKGAPGQSKGITGRRHVLIAATDVTEFKETQVHLQQQKEIFRLLVENVKDYAFFFVDSQGYVTTWNEGAERMTGYRAAEVVGRNHACFYLQSDQVMSKPAKLLAHAAAAGYVADEGWRVRKDGTRYWADTVISAVRDEKERLRGLALLTRDISERRRIEQELMENQARLQAILDNSPAPIFLKDREGRYLLVNRRFEALCRRTQEEILGKTAADLFPSAQAAVFTENDQKVLRTCASVQFEEELALEEGLRTNLIMKFPLLDPEGTISAIGGIATDITESIRATEALRENEERTRTILDRAHSAFVEIDERGLITAWNAQAKNLFGWQREEVLGRLMYEIIVPPQYREAHLKGFYRYLETGEAAILNKKIEMSALKRDGTEFPVELSVSPLELSGKRTFHAFIADITERKHAMEQVQRSHEQLQALTARLESIREEERTRIAHEIHDELGQALTGLKLDLAWLKQKLVGGETSVVEKLESMAKLTDGTMQSVREIATELRPIVLDQFGLLPALEWTVRSFQTRTGIQCKLNLFLRDVQLNKDTSSAVYRIFQEVLTNIARHAQATEVAVTVQEKAGRFQLEVVDNGRGITREQATNPQSFGVIGMQYRAAVVHGEIVIDGSKKGTTVRITVPLE